MNMKIFVIFVWISVVPLVSSMLTVDPEVFMNITQIIKFHGYPCEEYEVVTEDGYILSMQRIPYGTKNQQNNGTRPVALLQHGLLDSATTWIINLPNESPAYILADMGFDVWLANSRGTTYSKKHTHLSPKSSKFWDFSFDEMAKYDVPACIKFALKTSGVKKLSYIGHSQGSLIGFAQFSRDNNTANMVSSFVGLGPVTKVKYITEVPRFSIKLLTDFAPILQFLFHGEFFPNSEIEKIIADTICNFEVLRVVCYDPIFWIAGFDLTNLNKSRLPVIIGHTPAGTSIKNMLHYNQLVNNGEFQMYDYGSPEQNEYKYGTKTPPKYDITKLSVPLGIFWGGKDTLADKDDVQNMIPLLRNSLKISKFIPYYNHMDYVWGIDAHTVIYEEMIAFIRSNL